MDSGKYDYCSETSSPALSSDELPTTAHHHSSLLDRERSGLCQQLLMSRPTSSGSGSAMEREKEYHQQQREREREREMNCSLTLTKQQRINECLRAAAAAAGGGGVGANGGSSAGSDVGQGSSNSSCHNYLANYERNLNFATVQLDDSEYGFPKKKTVRDPLSHRIIEKRRRDRMNNCLADLARLLPQASLRKGRGRIEKTEIVELAIKHLQHLQTHPCPHGDNCEYSPRVREGLTVVVSSNFSHSGPSSPQHCLSDRTKNTISIDQEYAEQQYQQGYQECMNETMSFLVDRKGIYPGDSLCLQLVKHLAEKLNMRNTSFGGKVELCDSIGKRMPPACSGSVSNSGDERSDSVYDRASEDKHSCSTKHASMNAKHKPCGGDELMMLSEEDKDMDKGNGKGGSDSVYDVEDDNRSCSSPAQLTIVESGVPPSSPSPTGSASGTNANVNPIIPTIICTNSSSPTANNRESPGPHPNSCNEHSPNESADEGSCASADHPNRYKFKSSIKQRFTAEVSPVSATAGGGGLSADHLTPATCGSQFRSSNNSSRSSNHHDQDHEHGSELEEDTHPCGEVDEIQIIPKPKDSSQSCGSVRSLLENEQQGKEHKEKGRKSPSPEMPFVSVVKMSTLIESDDESCSIIPVDHQEQQRRKEEYDYREKLAQNANPINLSKSACSSSIAAPQPIRSSPPQPVRMDKGVPVFALSEQGQFYIPLTIHKSILEPFNAELEELDTAKLMNKLPLYPVTISVCFAPKHKNQTANSQPLASQGGDCKVYGVARKEEPLQKAHESKLSQCLQGRIPPLTASSTIPDFNTVCELERRKRLLEAAAKSNYTPESAMKHVLGKYAQPYEKIHKECPNPELDDGSIVNASFSRAHGFEESCSRSHSRKHDRERDREREHETGRAESRNSTSSSASGGAGSIQPPNYLYPILLGACTPKIYQSKVSGGASSNSGTRSASCHSLPHQIRTSPPTAAHSASNSCSTSPILRKRCNPSVSPPPVAHRNASGWRDAGAGAGFHHPGITIDVTDNGSHCSSRNSSPGAGHCDPRFGGLSKSQYAQLFEANQSLWSGSSSGDSEMLKHTLLQRTHDHGHGSSGSSRRTASPKRSRKDEDAYSIPKIITLK